MQHIQEENQDVSSYTFLMKTRHRIMSLSMYLAIKIKTYSFSQVLEEYSPSDWIIPLWSQEAVCMVMHKPSQSTRFSSRQIVL